MSYKDIPHICFIFIRHILKLPNPPRSWAWLFNIMSYKDIPHICFIFIRHNLEFRPGEKSYVEYPYMILTWQVKIMSYKDKTNMWNIFIRHNLEFQNPWASVDTGCIKEK